MLEEQSKAPPFTVNHVHPGITVCVCFIFYTDKVPMISELSWLDLSGIKGTGAFLFSSFLDF